jgi:hypothetical protein
MQSQSMSFPSNSNKAQPEVSNVDSENQLSYISPVLFALILPALIGLSGPDVLPIYRYIFYVFLGSLPAVVIIRICFDWAAKNESFVINLFRFLRPLKYLENLPSSIVFKADHKKFKLPWVTLILIKDRRVSWQHRDRFAAPALNLPFYNQRQMKVFQASRPHFKLS